MKFFKLKNIELRSYILMLLLLCMSIFLSYNNQALFELIYAAEDGVIEWSTTILLSWISMYLLYKFIRLKHLNSVGWKAGMLGFITLFLFAAGEEISWGQRLFNIESGKFFLERNSQQETNLHNLMLGEHSVNKIVFGKLIVIGLFAYLFVIPYLVKTYKRGYTLVNNFAIPIVRRHHKLAFVLATVLVMCINSDKKWEVYEFCFALIFALIFYNPKNKTIYREHD